MKNSKAKNKPVKASENIGQVNSSTVAPVKSVPSEEDIREKAEDIYHQRTQRGEHGTPENDWLEAEAYLKDSKD